MQRFLRIAAFLIVTLLSLETLFWVLDNVARWEWVEAFVSAHPYLAGVLHSPLMAFVLLWTYVAVRWGEKRLKFPEFIVEFSRMDAIPQLSAITAEMVIENQVGTVPYDFVLNIYIANRAEVSVFIRDIEASVKAKKRFLAKTHTLRAETLDGFTLSQDVTNSHGMVQKLYTQIQNMLPLIANQGLFAESSGVSGWLRFVTPPFPKETAFSVSLTIWDGLGRRHKAKELKPRQEIKGVIVPPI